MGENNKKNNKNTKKDLNTTSKSVQKPTKNIEEKKKEKTKKSLWWLLLLIPIVIGVILATVIPLSLRKVHTHSYSETWSVDDEKHWHECTGCDDITDEEEHSIESGKCSVCDYIEETEGLGYTLLGDHYQVASIGDATVKYIKIPAMHNGIPVTEIGPGAFFYNNDLLGIEFPNITILRIGAFTLCNSLTKIVIPAGVTNISDCPIYWCTGITEIIVESGNTKYHVEGNCLIETETGKVLKGFNNSIIPETAKSIGDSAFNYCLELTSIVIPKSVLEIGEDIFEGSSNLSKIYYYGNEEEWNNIDKHDNNPAFTSETIYYFSKEEPTTAGKYWHYVEGVATSWDEKMTYKVEHYKEKLDGTYELVETIDGLLAKEGTVVSATPKDYDGFVRDTTDISREEGMVVENGSLVLEVHYNRVTTTLTLNKGDNIESVTASGAGVTASGDGYTVKYGAEVTLSATPSTGYEFDS